MTASPELQFDSYKAAALRSEHARLTWMLVAFSSFVILGFFRCFVPVAGAERAGPLIIGLTIPYLIFEFLSRRMVGQRMADGRRMPVLVQRITSVIECSFPLAGIVLLILLTEFNPYTLLVSPAYAMILIIMALSPLQLDPGRSLVTGITGTMGYLAIVIFVVLGSDLPNPHPTAMYFMLTAMLGIATVAITFVTIQVRQYVIGTVRELETRRRNERMQHDLELARDIQRGLLPDFTPAMPGYDMAAMSRAAELAGGDYYDWQIISEGRIVITLADVTGHGVGPALVTAACRAYVRAMVGHNPDPLAIISRVNHLLHDDLSSGRFVTFALIDLDTSTHQGIFLSAGHGPSLWMQGGDGSANSIDAQGLPLGIVSDQDWDDAYRVDFKPTDVLVLFSDGFFETLNGEGKAFGLERLQEIIRKNRHDSAAQILQQMDEAIIEWQGDLPQQDDITAIVIKRLTEQSAELTGDDAT